VGGTAQCTLTVCLASLFSEHHILVIVQISMKNIILLILVFYILILIQTSFLVHFNIFSGEFREFIPIFIIVVLINLFESRTKFLGIFSGILGGFFLDIFSGSFFGFYTVIFLGISLFIKFVLKKYVQPVLKRA